MLSHEEIEADRKEREARCREERPVRHDLWAIALIIVILLILLLPSG